MGYNILGINASHNGSVCVLKNGKIDFFLEEERISKFKTDNIPLNLLKSISEKYKIDEIAFSGLSQRFSRELLNSFNLILELLFPYIKKYSFLEHHHLCHTLSSFFNSNFKKCLGVVIDGAGSYVGVDYSSSKVTVETESIYILDYKNPPSCIYKSNRTLNLDKEFEETIDENLSLAQVYDVITKNLKFQWNESGKTMGLSSYGTFNSSIPPLYINSKGNPKLFRSWFNTPSGTLKEEYNYLFNNEQLKKDIAYKVQQESQQIVGDLIEKGLKETGLKQVCCSGGYFLNCVANYYLTKRFPNIDFYFEPISSDAGTAIGAAKLAWHQKTQDKTIRPQKTLYYGPKYTKEQLLKGIQKYLD